MADFGRNRVLISLALFLNMTFYAFSIILAGRYYDRYGPKWVIIIPNILLIGDGAFLKVFQIIL